MWRLILLLRYTSTAEYGRMLILVILRLGSLLRTRLATLYCTITLQRLFLIAQKIGLKLLRKSILPNGKLTPLLCTFCYQLTLSPPLIMLKNSCSLVASLARMQQTDLPPCTSPDPLMQYTTEKLASNAETLRLCVSAPVCVALHAGCGAKKMLVSANHRQ